MTRYDHIKFPEYIYQEYPKWVGDVIVNNAEEEQKLLGIEDDDAPEVRIKRPYTRKDK